MQDLVVKHLKLPKLYPSEYALTKQKCKKHTYISKGKVPVRPTFLYINFMGNNPKSSSSNGTSFPPYERVEDKVMVENAMGACELTNNKKMIKSLAFPSL